jgi:hypothetical protein
MRSVWPGQEFCDCAACLVLDRQSACDLYPGSEVMHS